MWGAMSGEVDGELPLGDGHNAAFSSAMSPDNRRVVCSTHDGSVRVWSVKSRREVLRPIHGHDDCVRSVIVSPGGKCVVSGSGDGALRVRCMQSGVPAFGSLEEHNDSVNCVPVSPECR